MGIIPASGTEVAMGKIRNAYGLSGAVQLRGTLGAQIGISSGEIRMSFNPDGRGFGGRTTPNDYA